MENTQFKKIFVAIDFSSASDEALRRAHALATETGAGLAVCHIIPNDLRIIPLFPHLTSSATQKAPGEITRGSEAVAARVREVTGAAPEDVSTIVDHGMPYAEIVNAAEDWGADLIVLGSHGMTSAAGVFLGSVTHRIIRHAHATVLVARPIKKGGIVAGTDFSDPALPAVSAAVEEARRTKRPLTLVHSIDVDRVAASHAAMALEPPLSPGDYTSFIDSARERLNEALRKLHAKGETLVATGSPGPTLVRIAAERDADLLVVGTLGLTGLTRMLLGSVAEYVASQAPCSVMIRRLHPPDRP